HRGRRPRSARFPDPAADHRIAPAGGFGCAEGAKRRGVFEGADGAGTEVKDTRYETRECEAGTGLEVSRASYLVSRISCLLLLACPEINHQNIGQHGAEHFSKILVGGVNQISVSVLGIAEGQDEGVGESLVL